MGKLWDLYEEFIDRQPFPPSQRRVAAKLFMSPTALGNWRTKLTSMPDAENLVRFAELINVPYVTVVDAALHDAGYLPKPKVQRNEGLGWQEQQDLLEQINADEAKSEVSDESDRTDLAIAAHEDGDIAGEQESYNEP